MLSACVGPNWQPVAAPIPRPLDSKTTLEFHFKATLVRLHGVRFSGDSLSGIPWLEHLTCDTCRVSYALADISQARIGHPGQEAWNLVIPVVAVFSLLAVLHILVCGGTGPCT